jgi:hypothetical protein
VHATGWSQGLDVTADGQGIVSHAGLVLLRALADKTGLTVGLSRALATPRLLVHDRGRVLADLAAAIAGGAQVISEFAVVRHQEQLLGPVASVPTTWRTLAEIASGGTRAQARITKGSERGPAVGVGGDRGPPRRHPRNRDCGQDPGRGDLHPAGRHRHPGALGQGTG